MVDALSTPTTPTAPVDAYMNPYKSDVLDQALKTLDISGQKQRNAIGTQAFQSGAYGDARHGIEDLGLDKTLASAAGSLSAGINSDAFDKAMGYLNTDLDRSTGVSEFNAGLDQNNFSNMLAAMGLGNTLNQSNITNSQSMIDALLGLDQYDKTGSQDQLNVNFDNWNQAQNWDANQLAQYMGFLQGQPQNVGTSQTTSSPNNSWASMLGAALSGLGGGSNGKLFG